MAQITMTLEEYESLRNGLGSTQISTSGSSSNKKKTRKSTSRDKALSRALKSVNKRARKKDNTLRSGWTQAKIMKEAHRMCK